VYLLDYLLTRARAGWARIRDRDCHREEGLTTLEVAIIAGGLALLAIGVVAVITTAVKSHEADIK